MTSTIGGRWREIFGGGEREGGTGWIWKLIYEAATFLVSPGKRLLMAGRGYLRGSRMVAS